MIQDVYFRSVVAIQFSPHPQIQIQIQVVFLSYIVLSSPRMDKAPAGAQERDPCWKMFA